MKILIVGLVYGDKSNKILISNIKSAGHQFEYKEVNKKGISQALNDGLDLAIGYDAVAFLANDIVEPENWLTKKIEALDYPMAGAVASSLGQNVSDIRSDYIISNWMLPISTCSKIGYFDENMFPYGPIDLDYCDRCWAAGLKTYYAMNCEAIHMDTQHDYGFNKLEAVNTNEKYRFKKGDNFYKSRLRHEKIKLTF